MFHTVPPRSATVAALPLSVRIAPVSVEESRGHRDGCSAAGAEQDAVIADHRRISDCDGCAAVPHREGSAAELTLAPEMASLLVTPAGSWKRKPKLPGPGPHLPPLSAIDRRSEKRPGKLAPVV